MSSERVFHFISPGPGLLREVLENAYGMSETRSRELFTLGSLYLNKARVFDPETPLKEGDYLRIHSVPRRYLKPEGLKARVLGETDLWWIVDKPSGIPCHATVDNGIENLQKWLGQEVGGAPWVTHRLDVPTSGCLVYAKDVEGVRVFNKLLLAKKVHKEYEALVQGRFDQTGVITHWMKKGEWAPREVFPEEQPDTLLCQLEILESEVFESCTRLRIRLLTGRTHQIRVQMQALGHPILNDVMYSGRRIVEKDAIALKARKLEIEQSPERRHCFEAPVDWSDWLTWSRSN